MKLAKPLETIRLDPLDWPATVLEGLLALEPAQRPAYCFSLAHLHRAAVTGPNSFELNFRTHLVVVMTNGSAATLCSEVIAGKVRLLISGRPPPHGISAVSVHSIQIKSYRSSEKENT